MPRRPTRSRSNKPTRKELNHRIAELDDVGASGEYSVHDLMLATIKDVYDGDLTAGEQRLLDDPGEHLSQKAIREIARIDFNIDCMEHEP